MANPFSLVNVFGGEGSITAGPPSGIFDLADIGIFGSDTNPYAKEYQKLIGATWDEKNNKYFSAAGEDITSVGNYFKSWMDQRKNFSSRARDYNVFASAGYTGRQGTILTD